MTSTKYIALIGTSLALLAVLEVLWLHRVWKEEYARLQQQTDYLFHQSVAALQDSLVMRSMRKNRVWPDSLEVAKPMRAFRLETGNLERQPADTLQLESKAKIVVHMDSDSANCILPSDNAGLSQVQVVILSTASPESGPIDGFDRLLMQLPRQFRSPGENAQLFKFEKDVIPAAHLEEAYRQTLQNAGIPLDFDLIRKDSLPFARPAGSIITRPASAGLLVQHFYIAVFPKYKTYLLGQILAAVLFALLLFGVTTTAFILIYRSLRQQQRLTRLKNEFISNITHELKTPITTVGVALEALSNFDMHNKPEKLREYLAHSKLELDRLSLLVEKVLRLSMFEEQEPRLKPEPLDLAAVLRQVTAAMSLQAERAGATIQVDIPPEEQFLINGDRLHLSSVVFNLLDNALKYTDGKPEINISLKKTTDGRVRLLVRDNGIGIPETLRDKVFDKFFRIQGGNRHDVKGHGLGLSYAAKVVQQHGGRIWVESPPGQGSIFTVEFKHESKPTQPKNHTVS